MPINHSPTHFHFQPPPHKKTRERNRSSTRPPPHPRPPHIRKCHKICQCTGDKQLYRMFIAIWEPGFRGRALRHKHAIIITHADNKWPAARNGVQISISRVCACACARAPRKPRPNNNNHNNHKNICRHAHASTQARTQHRIACVRNIDQPL